ncbi:hypothetical protein [Paenibacillus aceti]|uniref:YokE-like PH domain-containing protein n=1 Tax=Paenibacillus aceti TaxID=1820010 RepID=A0ABQ1VZD9_9BACL|nr:hypothetical protein [Paenibacillus aceti]GGG07208.1 hypothetical protein GCM10010913_31270 [Paenibacillus aceti]
MNIIRNFRDESVGLDLDTLTEIKLFKSMSRTTIHYYRGFYINCQNNLVGVIATGRGPAFFLNLDIYFLRERPFRFTLESDHQSNTIHFMWGGQQKMNITYSRELYFHRGIWFDDEKHDFFIWLIRAVDNRKFYEFYTLNRDEPLACSLSGRGRKSMINMEHPSRNAAGLE